MHFELKICIFYLYKLKTKFYGRLPKKYTGICATNILEMHCDLKICFCLAIALFGKNDTIYHNHRNRIIYMINICYFSCNRHKETLPTPYSVFLLDQRQQRDRFLQRQKVVKTSITETSYGYQIR